MVAASIKLEGDLSAVFFANGEGFLRTAGLLDGSDDRHSCYATAIATELVLKAFLLSRGWSDGRCRRDIGHDLVKALAFAQAEELKLAPNGLGDVIGVLNAYYPRHAFDSFVAPAGDTTFAAQARGDVADLFDVVRPHMKVADDA